jgi:septum formation protein
VSDFIYLASQSPRRSQLLSQLGVRHEVLLPDAAEDAEGLEAIHGNEAPKRYVQRVTALKLEAALARLKRRGLPTAPVLCSDTTVALGVTIYGKPENSADAKRMLKELSGQTHRVLTAVVIGDGRRAVSVCSVSQVRFAPLSAAEIAGYVATEEPMGKAGGYAVQGRAAGFIAHISGSYSGIMGLPLFETAGALKSLGFDV